MWRFQNPVKILFGQGCFNNIGDSLKGRAYALTTYGDPVFDSYSKQLHNLTGIPALTINDVSPNPDFKDLERQCNRWANAKEKPEVIIAVGGGSVMDTAKVLAAASGDFSKVRSFLKTGANADQLVTTTPIIAVPTTAGTGSEVTSWATVWDSDENKKYSLNLPTLYPEVTYVDPELTAQLPVNLTISTALDALSHALESIWNKNRNNISTLYAIEAVQRVVRYLPELTQKPDSLDLRSQISLAALYAGLAFSNTKTALAHNISYPITLELGVVHGIACSFTLPKILESVIGESSEIDGAISRALNAPISECPAILEEFINGLGVSTRYQDYGISSESWQDIVEAAFRGERGKNFIGDEQKFIFCTTES